jgi:hypothetical protein
MKKIDEGDRTNDDYYLCAFIEIIGNKKLEKRVETDDDAYILYIKRCAIKNYSGLGGGCDI